jgi:hypothetical protein
MITKISPSIAHALSHVHDGSTALVGDFGDRCPTYCNRWHGLRPAPALAELKPLFRCQSVGWSR